MGFNTLGYGDPWDQHIPFQTYIPRSKDKPFGWTTELSLHFGTIDIWWLGQI